MTGDERVSAKMLSRPLEVGDAHGASREGPSLAVLSRDRGDSSSRGHKPRRFDAGAPRFVRDVMTLNVVTVSPQATLQEAVGLLVQNHVSGLPVVRGSLVVGILSEKDIARVVLVKVGLSQLPSHLLALVREFSPRRAGYTLDKIREVLASTPVGQAMTDRPIVVAPDTPVDQAAQSMIEHRVHRLPVVDRGTLVGIVTREDITRASADILAGDFD